MGQQPLENSGAATGGGLHVKRWVVAVAGVDSTSHRGKHPTYGGVNILGSVTLCQHPFLRRANCYLQWRNRKAVFASIRPLVYILF